MEAETELSFPFNLPIPELQMYSRALKRENKSHSIRMEKAPAHTHADQTKRSGGKLIEVWRSNKYLCQIYARQNESGLERLSICRCEVDVTNRRWRDGLTWEELMQVKREVGYGNFDAAEAYPKDKDIVNVANFRHLFVFREPVTWIWRQPNE